MNLFEIDRAITECIDEETGELFDEEKFENLSMKLEDKLEGTGCWIKNLQAQAAALKAEEIAFKERRAVIERKAESVKKYLTAYLQGRPFETAKVKISFRKSETLEVAEGIEASLPEEYLRFKQPEVNKAELKKAVKAGKEFDGVKLVTKENISIK